MYHSNRPSYLVHLQGCENVPSSVRMAGEARFARELEAVLGGEEFVAETYATWLDVTQSEANRNDRSTAMTAARWPVALAAATQAGFSLLGDIGAAHFEVRLERHARADRRPWPATTLSYAGT